MTNFLDVFNAVAATTVPPQSTYKPFETLEQPFAESGLDSLEVLMTSVFLAEIYGIPEEIAKEFAPPTCPADLLRDIEQHKTKEPTSVAEALEVVK